MKRYIRSNIIEAELKSAGYSKVLERLKDNFEKQGQRCEVNKAYRCVDLLDDKGCVVGQAYPQKSGSVPKNRAYFQYVGPGRGDYIRLTRTGTSNRYQEADPYMKFVMYTNDPSDDRHPIDE